MSAALCPTFDHFQVEASTAGEVEGRAAVNYRFRLHDPDGWQAVLPFEDRGRQRWASIRQDALFRLD